MKILLLLYILSLGTLHMSAQISGKVLDGKNRMPLQGVNIYLQQDSLAIGVTNQQGEFNITRSYHPKDTIVFSYVGYQAVRHTLADIKKNGNQIMMNESPQLLNEITVSGTRKSYYLNVEHLSDLPSPLYSFGGFLLNGNIYTVAGDETKVRLISGQFANGTEAWEYRSSNMFVYNIQNNSTTTRELKLEPRSNHAAHFYNDKVFIIGGKRFSTNRKLEYTDETLEIYDFNKDTLYVEPINPHQAVNFTSFIYDDNLYIMGGAIKERVFSNQIHVLDLKKGIWYEIDDTIPKEWCGERNGILVGHTVYIFGGYRTAPMWNAISYDLRLRKWKTLCGMKDGVSYPGLATDGKRIYILENKNLQIYTIAKNSMDIHPVNLELENCGLFYFNKKLYIVGGCSRNGIYVTPSAGIYSIDLKQINIE